MPRQIEYKLGDRDMYNPVSLSRFSESELRGEYTRLRKTALSRLRAIERSEDFGDSAIVTNNRQWLSTTPAELPGEDLPLALSRLETFLETKTGTLTGLRRQRARALESLKDAGIRGINKRNYGQFQKFMIRTQIFRDAYIPYPKRAKGTEARDAARQIRPRMFSLTENGNVSEAAIMKEFQFFRDNLDKIEKLVRDGKINTDRKRPYSANELRKLLGMSSTKAPSLKSARDEAKSRL